MADRTPLMQSILSAAASDLTRENRPAARVELVAGQVAWDECCDGLLYLRIVSVYPSGGNSSNFPQMDFTQSGIAATCAIHMLAYQMALGVIRCSASVDSQGNAPTPAQVSADGAVQHADLSTLLSTLMCTVPSLQGVQTLKIDRYTPSGPAGGCAGGEWGFYLALDPCVTCE